MVVKENVGLIIMLCAFQEKGKVKCHQYLPESELILRKTGDSNVKINKDSEANHNSKTRETLFSVKDENEEDIKLVTHYHVNS